jgi:hypothetical protein
MATKTILENDGSVMYSKQSNQWLQERLNGVLQSITGSAPTPHPDDVKIFKAISDEIGKRGI